METPRSFAERWHPRRRLISALPLRPRQQTRSPRRPQRPHLRRQPARALLTEATNTSTHPLLKRVTGWAQEQGHLHVHTGWFSVARVGSGTPVSPRPCHPSVGSLAIANGPRTAAFR